MNIKYIIIVIFLFLNPVYGICQNNDSEEFTDNDLKRKEIKINLAYLLWGYTEIAYEKILFNTNSTIGASLGRSFFDKDETNIRFALTPYYRTYFGKSSHTGFFLEGSLLYLDSENLGSNNEVKVLGVGIAFGFKLLRINGSHVDFYLGLTRNIYDTDKYDAEDFYPRLGLMLGKRVW